MNSLTYTTQDLKSTLKDVNQGKVSMLIYDPVRRFDFSETGPSEALLGMVRH